jgi:spore coat protein U-like protein
MRGVRVALIVSGAVLLCLLCSSPAMAQGNVCTISTTSVAFGSYDVFSGANVDSTGTVTINCGSSVRNLTVSLSKGASGTYANRTMVKSGENLAYNLYTNAACTIVWGDGTAGTQTYFNADPPNSTNVVLTIYGRITALQDVSAGAYSDTITATINW